VSTKPRVQVPVLPQKMENGDQAVASSADTKTWLTQCGVDIGTEGRTAERDGDEK
jgi:hypothetical protein